MPNRTLLGVMPEDMARAVAAARERAPIRDKLPAREKPTVPPQNVGRTMRAAHTPGQPQPPERAPRQAPADAPRGQGLGVPAQGSDGLRAGGTIVGAALPTAQPAPTRVLPPPQRTTPARLADAPAAEAELPGAARDPGTVRSISSDPERLASPGRPLATSFEADPFEADPFEAEPEPDPVVNDVPLPMHARTHLGVAIPGIAPLHAGLGHPKPAPRAMTALDATQLQPDSIGPAPVSARATMPRSAFVLLGSGLALLLAAGAFALLWRGGKPISVAISADASGKDRIDLVCQECPDGTLVSLKDSRAEISGRKAYLTLSEPLPLGENRVSFGLQRPGAKEPEAVDLTLPPVEYRIRPDTSTLGGDQPRLTLKIAAIPGSKVEIARQLVALDAAGNGEIAVDLSGQLIGPASEVTSFEQSIGYLIAPPSGKVYEGQLAFKIGVTPLLLEAPGVDTVTDLERFMLAGRTTKGAELWVAGTTIAVDSSGRFAQLMSIDSVGETRVTVRATEPGLAPRFASFRLQRVENLQTELNARRRKAVLLSDVTGKVADHVGSTVVVSGRVEEARVDGHRSLVILQADGDCGGRSCLVRLMYGGLRKLSRGELVTALGRLQGTLPSGVPGSPEVPEVDVSLLL